MNDDDTPTIAPPSDDALLGLLRRALDRADPMPDAVRRGASAAFSWRTIDAELAELVYDSASDLVGVRGEHAERQLTFRAPGVEIEVMMIEESRRRLIGQLVPPMPARVELATADAVGTTVTDDLGRFVFDTVQPGPVRLTIVDDQGRHTVRTEWLVF